MPQEAAGQGPHLVPSFTSAALFAHYMSYSLNFLKGGYIGIIRGATIGLRKGDTRSVNQGSYIYVYTRTVLVVILS